MQGGRCVREVTTIMKLQRQKKSAEEQDQKARLPRSDLHLVRETELRQEKFRGQARKPWHYM